MADLSRIETVKQGKIFRLWDIPVFVIILLIIGGMLIAAFSQKSGDTVSVYISNKLHAEYPLNMDAEHELTSADKKYKLTLVIKDKKAYVKDENCPDHICANSGKISRVHQSISCVPAKIVIRITGMSDTDGIVGGNNEK